MALKPTPHPILALLPLSLLLTHVLLNASLMALTPKHSPLRPLGPLVALALTPLVALTSPYLSASYLINSMVSTLSTTKVLQAAHQLLILRVDAADLAREYRPPLASTPTWRLVAAGVNTLFSDRGVGTRWQAQGTPAFPAWYTTSPPSRGAFLLRQTAILAWQYALLDFFHAASQLQDPATVAHTQGPGTEWLFLSATPEQLATRVALSLASGLVAGRAAIDLAPRLLSIVCTAAGVTSPADWPPNFGRMRDAYSLRRVWGVFWHQFLRWPLGGLAGWVAHDILKIPPRSLAGRYARVAGVFALSGALHVAHDVTSGVPLSQSKALLFFLSFPVGFAIEDAVQTLWRVVTGITREEQKARGTPAWQQVVGYVWVGVWFSIFTPFFLLPSMRLAAEYRSPVPVNLLEGVDPVKAASGLAAGGLVLVFGFGAWP